MTNKEINSYLALAKSPVVYRDEAYVGCTQEEGEAIVAKAVLDEAIGFIEKMFSEKTTELRKNALSIDGIMHRRVTDSGIDSQIKVEYLHRFAVDAGIVPAVALSDEQKVAIGNIVKFDDVLVAICDKLTSLARTDDDWHSLYYLAIGIELTPTNLTDVYLQELKVQFGV